MKNNSANILITKASGAKVPFDKKKLKKSLLRAKAKPDQADEIVLKIIEILTEGISTKKIYKVAFQMLRKVSRPIAARYKLKQAIMELGPSGFPFERFVAELLNHQGFETRVGIIVKGHCVKHEIDVIAEKGNNHFMIECKYHSFQGTLSNVKIPLYIQSRFLDVEKEWKKIDGHANKFHQGWVVTNTRFSADAIKYSICCGLHLVSWDYPKKGSLKDWINESGLHPITCLTTLTNYEKQQLLLKNKVLSRDLSENPELLQSIGVSKKRQKKILHESSELCQK